MTMAETIREAALSEKMIIGNVEFEIIHAFSQQYEVPFCDASSGMTILRTFMLFVSEALG